MKKQFPQNSLVRYSNKFLPGIMQTVEGVSWRLFFNLILSGKKAAVRKFQI
jgi:hypothetical protein